MTRPLPPQFSALRPFVAEWAQPTEADRLAKLTRTSIADLKEFYDAVFARAEEIKTYLMPFRLDAMPDDAKTLLDLLLTFVETAHPPVPAAVMDSPVTSRAVILRCEARRTALDSLLRWGRAEPRRMRGPARAVALRGTLPDLAGREECASG